MAMRDSPLRAAALRARRSMGRTEPPAPAALPPSGLVEGLSTRVDRPKVSRPRSITAWRPTEDVRLTPPPDEHGLEGELARRLSRRVEGHVSAFHPDSVTGDSSRPEAFGEGHGGHPLWQSVLGHEPRRRRPASPLPEAWAWGLRWSDQHTFRQWTLLESNREATAWTDHVIAHPTDINPLVIQGAGGTGRSHLLHATGQAMLRGQQGGVVLLRHPASMSLDEMDAQLTEIDTRLSTSSGLLVDDIDRVVDDEDRSRRLHHIVDLAMNLGVQVVVVCEHPPSAWPSSPLARVMQEGVVTTMASPGPVDRLAALRSMVTREGLIVENADLQHLAEGHPTWRSLENALRAHLHASDTRHAEPSPAVTDHVQTATTVIERALDAVDAGGVIGGIELMAPVPELSDTWSPEVPDAEELLAGAPRPEEPARAVLEVVRDPRVDQLLRPNERDQYLVRNVEQLEASDAVRAADALAQIDLGAETAIARRRHHAEDQSLRLEALKARMEALADQAREADVEALLAITDELQAIDEELERIAQNARGPARLAMLRPVRVPEEGA